MKTAVVSGSGGFIGNHLVNYLKKKDYIVYGIDIKFPEFEKSKADEFLLSDLRGNLPYWVVNNVDEFYHLAADMGGIGYIETNKANIVYNNTMINMNVIKQCLDYGVKKFLFTSSACVYPGYLQLSEKVCKLKEQDAYPADAEDGYGWEKLMMERTCRHFMEDFGLTTFIARLHNIYGINGTYEGGKEKSPAALCRKVAKAKKVDKIEIWGDGKQTRSYCYVDDCVEALYRLMQSNYHKPINIGTDKLVSINQLTDLIIGISKKKIEKVFASHQPRGVMGRNADISLAREVLHWKPKISLEEGLKRTYQWIAQRVSR